MAFDFLSLHTKLSPVKTSPFFYFENEGELTLRALRVGVLPVAEVLSNPDLKGNRLFLYTEVQDPRTGMVKDALFHGAREWRTPALEDFAALESEVTPEFLLAASRRFEILCDVGGLEPADNPQLLRELVSNPHSELAVAADELGSPSRGDSREALSLLERFQVSRDVEPQIS